MEEVKVPLGGGIAADIIRKPKPIRVNLLRPKIKIKPLKVSGYLSGRNRINLLNPRVQKDGKYDSLMMSDFIDVEPMSFRDRMGFFYE